MLPADEAAPEPDPKMIVFEDEEEEKFNNGDAPEVVDCFVGRRTRIAVAVDLEADGDEVDARRCVDDALSDVGGVADSSASSAADVGADAETKFVRQTGMTG